MLQNCLDAAVEANRTAGEVHFTIRRVAVEAIPGIEAYREQFEGAVREREKGKQGGAERRVVKRIRRVLAAPDTQVLLCRDNGVGLNADRMKRILTEGNTDKSEAGAGAFGIGHLTAFAASDLRFIHYAGRSRSNGSLLDVASAHAVLASRTVNRNSGRGAHGFWLLGDDRTLFHPHPYPNTVPGLLRSEIECLEDTGSVVGVIGFNGFRSDEKPVEAISRVAAKNFLVAIWNGSMVVHIRDETTSSEQTVDRERLEVILDRERNRKRAEQGGGWLSGEQAYRAWQTLETGRKLRFEEDGVGGYFRSLSDGAGPRARSRVQVFRNGMWITNEADRLLPRDFNGFKPFDAILEIDSGAVGDLLRGAEGPEHRGLERRRLGRQGGRKLLDKLKELAARLREEAGRVEQSEEFTPTGFAMFRGDAEREAEKVPPYRPRRSPAEASAAERGEGEESTPQPDTDEEGGSVDREPGPGPRPTRPRRFTPKPGRSIRGRCSVRAIPDADGQLRELRVMWRPARGANRRSSDNLVVRVRVPSGSDETCVHPIGPRWLRISELHCNGEVSDPQDGGFEVELPRGEEPFTIKLADRIPDANAVEVDVVGRRPAASGGG
ncbi:MAG: hypothetical protein OXL34_12325 [Gemmatimonadota bacterium]|nr:hypothetical protein [Gemmatimonadota bacterium]